MKHACEATVEGVLVQDDRRSTELDASGPFSAV